MFPVVFPGPDVGSALRARTRAYGGFELCLGRLDVERRTPLLARRLEEEPDSAPGPDRQDDWRKENRAMHDDAGAHGGERTARDMLFSSHRRDNRVASFSSAILYAAASAVAVMIARGGRMSPEPALLCGLV